MAFWQHGYKWALQTAHMLEKYDVAFFEEAMRPDDIAGFAKLREHAPLPIAGGEVFNSRRQFAEAIDRGYVCGTPSPCRLRGVL